MQRKISLLQQWLKANNANVKNELAYCDSEAKYRDIQLGLDVMTSVLVGQNITKGSKFQSLENLVGTENPTIDFIRKASVQELYNELINPVDTNGIKKNLSVLNYNKIIDLYEEKKAKGEITMNSNSTSQIDNENTKNNMSENVSNFKNNDNLNKSNEYNNEKNIDFDNISKKETNKQNNYVNQSQRGFANEDDINKLTGNSLDCIIHGIRVVIIPNENGDYTLRNQESYSQHMEMKFNGGKDTQIINKKTLTKEEFSAFKEKYKDEILGKDYSLEKLNVMENTKENVNSFGNSREF